LIGFVRSAAMMLADKITATEADQLGTIYKVVKDEEFAFAKATTKKLAEFRTTGSIGKPLKALNASMTNNGTAVGSRTAN
jgi:2-(1,2-epoxy-1,2-dihydrophenyl)acetyl-CoA isomerase